MHPSGSYILNALEVFRLFANEVATSAKYDNTYITNYCLHPSAIEVAERFLLSSTNHPIVRYSMATVDGVENYQLPPNIHHILRVAIMDSNGVVTSEAVPRGLFNPSGPGWSIEGTCLTVRPFPRGSDVATFDLWFVPAADAPFHYCDGGGTSGFTSAYGTMPSTTTFVISNSPLLGVTDKRQAAYAGYLLRVLSGTGLTRVQERMIQSYDVTTNTATVRVAFEQTPTTPATDKLAYEVVPVWSTVAWQCIALNAAMNMGMARGLSNEKKQGLVLAYRNALKDLRDRFNNQQGRTGKSFERATVDNPDINEALWPFYPGRTL